ncbi:MAG: hypothetical protein COA74_01490 [Gammaproteobacteria bacterium]|nr:MAG: hypothetical protein COA74_01490 [Gammaproteobacteria bacterium]
MNWKKINFISDDVCDEWRAIKEYGKIIEGKKLINAVVEKWQPINPLLISKPGSRVFYPVLNVEQFKTQRLWTKSP